MKTPFLTIIGLLICRVLFAGPVSEEIDFKLGPKRFLDGDVIKIEEVLSTSSKLELGDTVTVKGKYRLDSRDAANLSLFLTQTKGDGSEEVDKTQTTKVTKGWNDFETVITIKHLGFLHLTFYDQEAGTPFGGVYFGTQDQMTDSIPVSVAHYPGD